MSKDMSVYYFHVRRGNVIYLDRQGVDLADIGSAWDYALGEAELLLRTGPDAPATECWVEIADDLGHVTSTPPRGTAFH
jgi:hypothetical protein